MKSKQIKKIIASMLTIVTVCGAVNIVPANAAKDIRTAKWAVAKNVATSDTTSKRCKLTTYTGTIKFRATDMTQDDKISSVTAVCKGYDVLIENNKRVSVTRKNADCLFSVKNNYKDYMYFTVTLETNATYYQYAMCSGKVYY